MYTFCESLREHAMKIINFEKKKLIPLTNEQQESRNCMKRQKSAAFVKKLEHEYTNDKSHLKFKNYCYIVLDWYTQRSYT